MASAHLSTTIFFTLYGIETEARDMNPWPHNTMSLDHNALSVDFISYKPLLTGDNFMKQTMIQVSLLSLEWITMHLHGASKNLLLILNHTTPFLQMEKCLSRVLLEDANIKYALKTVWGWLWPGLELEGCSFLWIWFSVWQHLILEWMSNLESESWIIVKCLNRHNDARIQILSDTKLQELASSVKSQYPDLDDVWCSMDGMKNPIQSAPHTEIQKMLYNSW